jgi:hypothetical protein
MMSPVSVYKKCYNTNMVKKNKIQTSTKHKKTTKKTKPPQKARASKQTTATVKQVETDGAYFLKLVLYTIIGSQWLWIAGANNSYLVPFPLGLIIGLFFASHEKFQIDRKIEYAVLLIAMLIGFWAGIGVTLSV